jgi:EmrB/QacA subfamily drug resistance transporter
VTLGSGAAKGRWRWLGLFVIALGVSMIIVDTTIVNVAIPAIIRDLEASSGQAQWIQESYTLIFATLLLIVGRLADRYGRRRLFLTGAVVFVLASLLAAASQSGNELIGARVIQGIGGAMMLPSALSLINAGFRGRDRGIAFAIWGATIGGTVALGPLLGGWLTTAFTWRYAFGVNLPVGAVVLAGTLLLVTESREDRAAGGVDIPGAVSSVLGFAAIIFGLIEGRSYGWWHQQGPISLVGFRWGLWLSPVPIAFAVGALALAGFATLERHRSKKHRPVLLDLSLFSIPSFRNGNIVVAIVGLGELGILFVLPLWFENARGYSAFHTGLALLPLAMGSFAASAFGAQIATKRGAGFAVRCGIAAELAGVAGLGAAITPGAAWWATIAPLFVYGMGVGLATAQLTSVVLADVPVAQSGQGSGTQSTTRQLGSALGIAILGTLLFSSIGTTLSGQLPDLPPAQRHHVISSVQHTAGASITGLAADPNTREIAATARRSFTRSTRWTAFTAAGFLALGLLATTRIRRETPAEEAKVAETSTG